MQYSNVQIEKLNASEALACDNFDQYRAIWQRWEELSEQTAKRYLDEPDGPQAECYHQYMQLNTYVVDDHGKPVPDYFLEFFANRNKADDLANAYLHAN